MKIFIALCVLLVATQSLSVLSFSENDLRDELNSGRHFWLVHRTGTQ